MSKHSPGPWVANKRGLGPMGETPGYEIQTDAPGQKYSAVVVSPARIRRADARLIAAAPELLDALKALLKGINDAIDITTAPMLYAPGMNEAKALVARIEGGK